MLFIYGTNIVYGWEERPWFVENWWMIQLMMRSLYVFCIMYILLCIYLSLSCISLCMFFGYLFSMAHCSCLGWFRMLLIIACVEPMFLYFKEWNINS
jgi:hypothetical protein